jgi:hypothetical protein
MTAAFKEIKAAAPGAHVLVAGYPQTVPRNAITALRHCPGSHEPGQFRADT